MGCGLWVVGCGGGFAEILRLRSQLFWHSLSHIRRFSPLRMTKRGDARRSLDDRLAHGTCRPLIGDDRGRAGSIGSACSTGAVWRIKSHKRRGVVEISVKCVPPWRRGRPKAGIDCPEGAELCRTVSKHMGQQVKDLGMVTLR